MLAIGPIRDLPKGLRQGRFRTASAGRLRRGRNPPPRGDRDCLDIPIGIGLSFLDACRESFGIALAAPRSAELSGLPEDGRRRGGEARSRTPPTTKENLMTRHSGMLPSATSATAGRRSAPGSSKGSPAIRTGGGRQPVMTKGRAEALALKEACRKLDVQEGATALAVPQAGRGEGCGEAHRPLSQQALQSMTSRSFAIVPVALASAIGIGRIPCSVAPAVFAKSIDIAMGAEASRVGSGSDFFQFPAYFPASEGNAPRVVIVPRAPPPNRDLPAGLGRRIVGLADLALLAVDEGDVDGVEATPHLTSNSMMTGCQWPAHRRSGDTGKWRVRCGVLLRL
jgi:hypothetical protein